MNSIFKFISTMAAIPAVRTILAIISIKASLGSNKNISVYCAESQDRITLDPSYSVTWAEGTYVDPATGIRRNAQGDYLCAMGTKLGQVGDRFLVVCKDKSYTIQLGDSKGDTWYDVYGYPDDPELGPISGYCLIEFIVDMDVALPLIKASGSYHTTGLIPTDIQYILPLPVSKNI